MTSVREIELAVEDGTISATPLADNLLSMGAAVLHAQGHALVAERQASLRILSGPAGLGMTAARAQATMRRAASYYLDSAQPKALALFAATDGVSSLMTSLAQHDEGTGEDLSRMLTAVAGAFDRLTLAAKDAARAARTNADLTKAAATRLSEALSVAIDQLEGEGGKIAQTRSRIAGTEVALYQAIDDVVKSSNSVRGGVKSLVSHVLGPFSDEENRHKLSPEGNETLGTDLDQIQPGPAQSIDTISTGIAGVAKAQSRIRAKNALLERQYQALATLEAMLASARTISDQTGAMTEASRQVHAAARLAPAITGALAQGMRDLADQAISPGNRNSVTAQIADAAHGWSQLETQLRQPQTTFAGIGRLFPPLALVAG